MSKTPDTDSEDRGYPSPEHAQRIQFEGCECVVMSPEEYESLYGRARQLEIALIELRAWKESSLAVEREWDAQAIAESLGATLGQSCRQVVATEVPRLLQRVKDLEGELKKSKSRWNGFWEYLVECENLAHRRYQQELINGDSISVTSTRADFVTFRSVVSKFRWLSKGER